MKKFVIIILLIAAAFIGYLAWSYFASSTSNTLIVPSGQIGSQKTSSTGSNLKNLQDNFLNSVKNNINTAKTFIEQIPQDVANTFNDLIDNTKNTAKNNLDAILQTTSSPASAPISGSPVPSGSASQNLSAQPHVCSIVPKGTLAGYGIDQPFTGAQVASYKVDWGDGESANGLFGNGEQSIVVSHSYSQLGTYSVTFQVISSSTSFITSRSVCVK